MSTSTSTPRWLADAVIYEIYPQSFNDSNGDGIGDLYGVIERLDYLSWLGINTIWFNPCFASPFRDAGYDVADYLTIAPRYGTNETMELLIAEARSRGIRVLLDLVAGHTSIEHPYFAESAADHSNHRYVWSDHPTEDFVRHIDGRYYLKNFFPEQPALNFGYARLDSKEPWRQLPDAEWPARNRQLLKDVLGFWLDRGVAGFRVDMAYSLVKDDPDLAANAALWREISGWMKENYPEYVLLPESDENRSLEAGVRSGFDGDFALVIQQEHSALFNKGDVGLLPWQSTVEPCYFDPDADLEAGTLALQRFLSFWRERWDRAGEDRLLVLPSSDHDFSRLVVGTRTREQASPAFTFLLTWGSVPSIYYGDEIGMRNLPDAPTTEGSRWNPRFDRAGCRTPMQWDGSLPNDGFSDAAAKDLYLPVDSAPDRPTVVDQIADPGSLLNHVRALLSLRRETPALRTHSLPTVEHAGYPFVYRRGEEYLVVVNPLGTPTSAHLPNIATATLVLGDGVRIADRAVYAAPFGHGIFRIEHAS